MPSSDSCELFRTRLSKPRTSRNATYTYGLDLNEFCILLTSIARRRAAYPDLTPLLASQSKTNGLRTLRRPEIHSTGVAHR